MKIYLISVFLLSLANFDFSCGKNKENIAYDVPGLWVGTYTVHQKPQQKPMYQSFVFKPDGKLIVDGIVPTGETYYSAGRWSLNGNLLTATYTTINFPDYTVNQKATFTFSNTGVLRDGTWTDVNNPYGTDYSGNFPTMKRVN
jgi:hypothetical protein